MEDAYRTSLFKSFTKTLEDGFFPVVIVDAIHDKVGTQVIISEGREREVAAWGRGGGDRRILTSCRVLDGCYWNWLIRPFFLRERSVIFQKLAYYEIVDIRILTVISFFSKISIILNVCVLGKWPLFITWKNASINLNGIWSEGRNWVNQSEC